MKKKKKKTKQKKKQKKPRQLTILSMTVNQLWKYFTLIAEGSALHAFSRMEQRP